MNHKWMWHIDIQEHIKAPNKQQQLSLFLIDPFPFVLHHFEVDSFLNPHSCCEKLKWEELIQQTTTLCIFDEWTFRVLAILLPPSSLYCIIFQWFCDSALISSKNCHFSIFNVLLVFVYMRMDVRVLCLPSVWCPEEHVTILMSGKVERKEGNKWKPQRKEGHWDSWGLLDDGGRRVASVLNDLMLFPSNLLKTSSFPLLTFFLTMTSLL